MTTSWDDSALAILGLQITYGFTTLRHTVRLICVRGLQAEEWCVKVEDLLKIRQYCILAGEKGLLDMLVNTFGGRKRSAYMIEKGSPTQRRCAR